MNLRSILIIALLGITCLTACKKEEEGPSQRYTYLTDAKWKPWNVYGYSEEVFTDTTQSWSMFPDCWKNTIEIYSTNNSLILENPNPSCIPVGKENPQINGTWKFLEADTRIEHIDSTGRNIQYKILMLNDTTLRLLYEVPKEEGETIQHYSVIYFSNVK